MLFIFFLSLSSSCVHLNACCNCTYWRHIINPIKVILLLLLLLRRRWRWYWWRWIGDVALTGCSDLCRENRSAETNVTCWPNTIRNNPPPTSRTLSRKSSPIKVAEETASMRRIVTTRARVGSSTGLIGRSLCPPSIVVRGLLMSRQLACLFRLNRLLHTLGRLMISFCWLNIPHYCAVLIAFIRSVSLNTAIVAAASDDDEEEEDDNCCYPIRPTGGCYNNDSSHVLLLRFAINHRLCISHRGLCQL